MREGSIIVLKKRARYVLYMSEENRDKPTLIFMHGLGRDLKFWRGDHPTKNVLEKLAKDFDVLAFDMPGYGLSGDLEDYEIDIHFSILFMHELLNRKDLKINKPMVLIGTSFGGLMSLKYSILYPQDVKGLVVQNPAGFGSYIRPSWRLVGIPILGEAILELDAEYPNDDGIPWKSKASLKFLLALFRYTFLRWTKYGNPAKRLARREYNNMRLVRYAVGLRGQNNRINHSKLLSGVLTPTQILMGSHDDVFSAGEYIRAIGEMPNARQPYIFKKGGHSPSEEYPDEFVEVVKDFVQSLD